MSEYIEIETEPADDPAIIVVHTNLALAGEETEVYESVAEMEEGSPLAQVLSYVEGIRALRIEGGDLTITRDLDTAWHIIVADVSAAVKDFFL